ncbi:unnamed protein product [Rhodiola kirilowii]
MAAAAPPPNPSPTPPSPINIISSGQPSPKVFTRIRLATLSDRPSDPQAHPPDGRVREADSPLLRHGRLSGLHSLQLPSLPILHRLHSRSFAARFSSSDTESKRGRPLPAPGKAGGAGDAGYRFRAG